MKRGRPSLRYEVQSLILENLGGLDTPISINALRKMMTKKMKRSVSWNTVQKYLQELIEIGRVVALSTPHSKIEGKEGLTVYTLKK